MSAHHHQVEDAPAPRRAKPASTRRRTTLAPRHDDSRLELVNFKEGPRVDSRDLARHFGKDHHDLFELAKTYRADFEEIGVVRFQTEKPLPGSKGGRPEHFALLTEDQAYLLLTYSRNTAKARALKIRLVKAFGEARRAAQMRGAEYLPTYHHLHDQIHACIAGSTNEGFIHSNFNRLVNKAVGIKSGQRSSVTIPQQSMLTIAQAVAAKAVSQATDHKAGYQSAKTALLALTQATMIEVGRA